MHSSEVCVAPLLACHVGPLYVCWFPLCFFYNQKRANVGSRPGKVSYMLKLGPGSCQCGSCKTSSPAIPAPVLDRLAATKSVNSTRLKPNPVAVEAGRKNPNYAKSEQPQGACQGSLGFAHWGLNSSQFHVYCKLQEFCPATQHAPQLKNWFLPVVVHFWLLGGA